jgi:tetratricopeptide (TPR) repeat protein
LFAIVGLSVVVTVSVMRFDRTPGFNLSDFQPTAADTAKSLALYVTYIGKMLWPLHLATPYPSLAMPAPWQIVGAFLLLAGVSCSVIWQRRQRPYLLVGWLWYLITLLPVIGLVKTGPHKMADRYVYLPLIGLFIMMAWGVPDLVKGWRHRRMLLGISAGVLVLGLAMGSWLQLRHWKDSMTLFRHTLHVTPHNPVAQNNLGVAHADAGDFEAAIGHYVEAVRMRPDYWKALFNLGVALADQGDLEAAIGYYSEAIRFEPRHAAAHHNLGVAVAKQGRLQEAIGHFSEALRLKPNYAEAHYNLGSALARQGSLKEAMAHYTEALKIKPDYGEVHYNLGVALTRQGNHKEAIGHFSEAVRIKPDYAKAHYNLGLLVAEQGRLQEAIGHFQDALRIKPDFVKARHNLQLTLGLTGKLSPGSDTLVRP